MTIFVYTTTKRNVQINSMHSKTLISCLFLFNIKAWASFFVLVFIFNCTFAKKLGYQTEEDIKLFKKSSTFSAMCTTYRICNTIEELSPIVGIGSLAIIFISLYEHGSISSKDMLVYSIPMLICANAFLIKKIMLTHLQTKYCISELDVEIHLGLFILE